MPTKREYRYFKFKRKVREFPPHLRRRMAIHMKRVQAAYYELENYTILFGKWPNDEYMSEMEKRFKSKYNG